MVSSHDFDNLDRAGMAVDTDFAEDDDEAAAAATPGASLSGAPPSGAPPPPPAAAAVFGPALDEARAFAGISQLGAAFWATPLFNGATLLIAVGLAGYTRRRRLRSRMAETGRTPARASTAAPEER
jgi:MprA protease rhombosortase-interaction domain-containing protein